MNLKRITQSGLVLAVSTITSWIGAALDHGDWFGITSTIFGIVGIFIGLWLAYKIDDFINI